MLRSGVHLIERHNFGFSRRVTRVPRGIGATAEDIRMLPGTHSLVTVTRTLIIVDWRVATGATHQRTVAVALTEAARVANDIDAALR